MRVAAGSDRITVGADWRDVYLTWASTWAAGGGEESVGVVLLDMDVYVETTIFRYIAYLFSRRMILSGLLTTSRRPDGALFSTSFATLFSPAGGMYEGSTPTGTPVHAAAGGVVLSAAVHPEYGNLVEIDHGNGLVTRYAHNSKMLVKAGDLIQRGQIISEVGTTGRSTGAHLHFEVLVDGVPQNPAKFLAGSGTNLATNLAPKFATNLAAGKGERAR